MTRDEFTTELRRGLRFVLQKHEREMAARQKSRNWHGHERELEHATAMTDAAIDQVSDHLFDAMEQLAQHGGVFVR